MLTCLWRWVKTTSNCIILETQSWAELPTSKIAVIFLLIRFRWTKTSGYKRIQGNKGWIGIWSSIASEGVPGSWANRKEVLGHQRALLASVSFWDDLRSMHSADWRQSCLKFLWLIAWKSDTSLSPWAWLRSSTSGPTWPMKSLVGISIRNLPFMRQSCIHIFHLKQRVGELQLWKVGASLSQAN